MTRGPIEAQRWDYVSGYETVFWDLEDSYGRLATYREVLTIGVRFDGDELVVGDLVSLTDRGVNNTIYAEFGYLFKVGQVAYRDQAHRHKAVYVPRREVFEVLRVKAPNHSWAWDPDESRRLTQEVVASYIWYAHVLMQVHTMPVEHQARIYRTMLAQGPSQGMVPKPRHIWSHGHGYDDVTFRSMVDAELRHLSSLRTVRHVS